MKAKANMRKRTNVSNEELLEFVKGKAYNPEKCISNLVKKTSETLEEILERYFLKTIGEWRQTLKNQTKFATSPDEKLRLYEQENKRIKKSIDSIDRFLQNKARIEIEKIVDENLKDNYNNTFLKIFLDQYGHCNEVQIHLKVISISELTFSNNLDTENPLLTASEYKAQIAKIILGSTKQGYRLTEYENTLKPAILNGFIIKIPSDIFFHYKKDALNQYANKIIAEIKKIRFYGSGNSKQLEDRKNDGANILNPSMRIKGKGANQEEFDTEKKSSQTQFEDIFKAGKYEEFKEVILVALSTSSNINGKFREPLIEKDGSRYRWKGLTIGSGSSEIGSKPLVLDSLGYFIHILQQKGYLNKGIIPKDLAKYFLNHFISKLSSSKSLADKITHIDERCEPYFSDIN